jgi:hypothetical protein
MPRFGRPVRRIIRRPIAGPRRPFGPPRPLPPGPMRVLAQAHRLLEEGQFAPAAEKFEMLANAARTEKNPRAPRLYFQAARSSWRAGQVQHGVDLLLTGLDLLAAAGAIGIVRQISSSAMAELKQLGHPQEAEQVKQFVSVIPGWDESAACEPVPPKESARPLLPTHCGQCGAVIRSDEVDWIDDQTAACAYCGSPIRPEGK